jgi:hypothetical protein
MSQQSRYGFYMYYKGLVTARKGRRSPVGIILLTFVHIVDLARLRTSFEPAAAAKHLQGGVSEIVHLFAVVCKGMRGPSAPRTYSISTSSNYKRDTSIGDRNKSA